MNQEHCSWPTGRRMYGTTGQSPPQAAHVGTTGPGQSPPQAAQARNYRPVFAIVARVLGNDRRYYGCGRSPENPICGTTPIPRLARMATGPSHRRRIPRRRLLGIEIGGAVALGAIAVAAAVGVSQATSSPACAWVMPVTGPVGAAAASGALGQTTGEATHYV